jgi:DNA-binding SARP family transcriptional activator/TolB-like protein
MTIRLRTLGQLAVVVDGAERPEMRARPVRLALLVYLALEREVSRDRILTLLWPESDQERARQALRQTLYALRRDLGEGWIESDHDTLRATRALSADATEVLDAIDAPRRVAELYRGAFLEGFHLAEAQPFQLWCDQWRARLERLNRRTRRALIDEHVSAGDLEAALVEARLWLDLDPLEDEAQHRVIELLFRLGRGEDALREYEAYTVLLAREDLKPLDETRALVAEMRSTSFSLPALAPTRREGALPGKESRSSRARWASPGPRVLGPAAVVVCLAAAGIFVRGRAAAGGTLEPTRIIVLPLVNETGDSTLRDVGLLATEWITHEVAHMGPLKAVPSLDVLQMLGAGMSGEQAAREREAGTLVSGRYFRAQDSIEIHVQITDLTRSELWDAVERVRVAPGHPESGLRVLTDRVAGSLAVRFIPGAPIANPSVQEPPSYPAFRELLNASDFVRRGDWAGALPHLERAARLDTTFYRAQLFVASAFLNLREYRRMDSVLDALAPKRAQFSEYERVIFQTGRAILRGDRTTQLALAKEGARLDPGGTLHYLSPDIALASGRPQEAVDMYVDLDPDCPWAPDWVSTWADLTGAYHLLGHHRHELAEARRSRKLHPNLLEPLFLDLRALAAMGRLDDLRRSLHGATAMAPEPGWSAGILFVRTAVELRVHGHPAAATEVLDSALAWYRSSPPLERSRAANRIGYADALLMAGDLDEAATVLRGLRQERPKDVDLMGRQGVLYARLGQRASMNEVTDSLEASRGPYSFGTDTYWRSAIAAWSGDTEEALRLLRRSFGEGHPRGIVLHEDPFLEPLWSVPAFALAVSDPSR